MGREQVLFLFAGFSYKLFRFFFFLLIFNDVPLLEIEPVTLVYGSNHLSYQARAKKNWDIKHSKELHDASVNFLTEFICFSVRV